MSHNLLSHILEKNEVPDTLNGFLVKYETNDYEPAIFGSIAHVRKMSTKKQWKNEKKR